MSLLAPTAGSDTNRLDLDQLYGYAWQIASRIPADKIPSGLSRDDLVQEAVTQAITAADQFRGDGSASFSTWAYTVMRQKMWKVIKVWRWGGTYTATARDTGRTSVSGDQLTESAGDNWEPINLDDLSGIDLQHRMDGLTDREYMVIGLLRAGYRQVEVAEIMDIKQPTVWQYARNAAKKMGLLEGMVDAT